MCFLGISNLGAQPTAFVYIKSPTSIEERLQKIMDTVFEKQYAISSSKRMYLQLKNYRFLQGENSLGNRQEIFKDDVAFILFTKVFA